MLPNSLRAAVYLGLVLSIVGGVAGWLLTKYPSYGIQIGGQLVEAVVVDMARQDAADIFQQKDVETTVKFVPECQKSSRTKSITICPDVAATVMLPAAVAAETVPGGHVPITYLPGKPEYAAYGVVHNELFDWDILPPSVLIAIVAAFVLRIVRRRDKLADFRREHGAGSFVICALLCLLVAFPCFRQTSGFFGWEYGIMSGDRRATPSELKEVQIKDGHYHAKFLITLEDGRSAWRTRQFTESEIDDAWKMKVGRKFDVVYLSSDPSYNRPDFADAYHAPRRKLWLALYLLASAGIWGIMLWALYWALGGLKSPSLFRK